MLDTKREICGSRVVEIPTNIRLAAGAACRLKLVLGKSAISAVIALSVFVLMLNIAVGLYIYRTNRNHCQELTSMQQQIEELRRELNDLKRSPMTDDKDYSLQLLESKDPEDTSLSSSSLRVKRNVKGKAKCPKGMSTIHLYGTTDEYTTNDGYINVWQQKRWCDDNKTPGFVRDKGMIKIPVTGVYIVYAQITYNSLDITSQFLLMVKKAGVESEEIVGSCYSRVADSENHPITCSTSLLVCLEKDSQIFVKSRYPDESFRMNETASYFGLTRVAKMQKCLTT